MKGRIKGITLFKSSCLHTSHLLESQMQYRWRMTMTIIDIIFGLFWHTFASNHFWKILIKQDQLLHYVSFAIRMRATYPWIIVPVLANIMVITCDKQTLSCALIYIYRYNYKMLTLPAEQTNETCSVKTIEASIIFKHISKTQNSTWPDTFMSYSCRVNVYLDS